ncbi:MAG: tRNA (guanosine(46)-N7)-methyltransferase TrmB, partial [Clostridia bacterium]
NTVLRDNGAIFFKTDNEKLYEFSLNEMAEFGFNLRKITFDLHSTDEENIVTEYEARFAEQGMRILRVEAHKKVN